MVVIHRLSVRGDDRLSGQVQMYAGTNNKIKCPCPENVTYLTPKLLTLIYSDYRTSLVSGIEFHNQFHYPACTLSADGSVESDIVITKYIRQMRNNIC